jgi:chromate reductase
MTYKIGIIVGSLRKESWNRKIAQVLISLAPKSLTMNFIEIASLPLYNEDNDINPSIACIDFKAQIKACDGLLFLTPEYNRSIPGVLKNAMDIASRPYGQSAWDGKPGAVISVSLSNMGGFGANHQLRQTFVCLNILCMQQPEAYIGNVANLFDSNNNLINDSTHQFLQKFMTSFAVWVATNTQ